MTRSSEVQGATASAAGREQGSAPAANPATGPAPASIKRDPGATVGASDVNYNHHQHQQEQRQEHRQQQQQQQQQLQLHIEQQQQPQNHHEQLQHQRQQEQRNQGDNYNNSNNNNKPKRNPFCSRCRNHGKQAQVKGHKRHCEYRDCQCGGCKLVECRQIVSAAQIKRRRYQKQDEECGRHIEISPPVLTREPNNDPAALIAKTLIGSKHMQQQHLVIPQNSKHLSLPHHFTNPGAQTPPNHHANLKHNQVHPHHLSPASIHLSASAGNLAPTGHHHLLSGGSSGIGGSSSSIVQGSSGSLQHQHHHQQHQQQQLTPTNGGSPVSHHSALGNALHLFHFPNSMFSAAATSLAASPHPVNQPPSSSSLSGAGHRLGSAGSVVSGQGRHLIPSSAAAVAAAAAAMGLAHTVAGTTNSSLASSISPSLPSVREQIQLVEEIHDSYGPLAIYAWLRSEQFDLQKVRDLIELSRVSFDELLQMTGHSPLDLTSPIVD